MKGKVLFREEQSFVGTWMWYLLIMFSVVGFIPIAILLFTTENSTEAIIPLVIFTIVIGGVIALFTFARLQVTIDDEAIYYRFSPFVLNEKHILWSQIKSAEVRTYSAIWEYGGYGYRYTLLNGRALNVTGDKGLQLELITGKKLLIGTQMADELAIALSRLKENGENTEDYG